MTRLVLLAGLLLAVTSSAANAPPPMLAVLELEAPDNAVTGDELPLLTDTLRTAVVKEVGDRYRVLTRETLFELIPAEKRQCTVGKCAAEIGRMLQAPYVLAGSVRQLGAAKVLTVEAYESNGGRLLGSEQLLAPTTTALFEKLRSDLRASVRAWFGGAPVSVAPVAPTTAKLATLSITSDVEEAEVSIDGRPQGVPVGRKAAVFQLPPGRKQVKVSRTGYLDHVQAVELVAGGTAIVTAHLEAESRTAPTKATAGGALSFLTITSEPKSALITIDGRKVGKTPRTVDVTPGTHRITLSLEWYA